MRNLKRLHSEENRRGGAAVEFALVAPLYIALVMGAIQTGFNFDQTNTLYSAVRQSGRLAALNASSKQQPGQSLNAKVILDIKNSLTAEGLPGSQATVTITHAEGAAAGTTFDLSDAANDYKYFKISVSVPYSSVNTGNFLPSSLSTLKAAVVFRKGHNSLVQ